MEENVISKEPEKMLKQISPTTASARPTLKAHKNKLKVRLITNIRGSVF